MPLVHVNCMVRNEATLLRHVLPFWQTYPVDEFVFLDDNSSDDTNDVIESFLWPDCKILKSQSRKFHEAKNRSQMLEYSRSRGADVVISLDADELLSLSLLDNFDQVISFALQYDVFVKQYNVVGDLWHQRTDPAYVNNYRNFLIPVAYTSPFDLSQSRYHTPRTPAVSLPKAMLPEYLGGFIHLQALNIRFYALKQLWYKTFEHRVYGKSVEEINAAYDPVVNGLEFHPVDMPVGSLLSEWDFNPKVFDEIAEQRKYVDYIRENSVPGLITFGEEYLN